MGVARIELATSALSVLRSNRLSYTPGRLARLPLILSYTELVIEARGTRGRRHVGASARPGTGDSGYTPSD